MKIWKDSLKCFKINGIKVPLLIYSCDFWLRNLFCWIVVGSISLQYGRQADKHSWSLFWSWANRKFTCVVYPLNSWPKVRGVASCVWVLPIFTMWANSLALLSKAAYKEQNSLMYKRSCFRYLTYCDEFWISIINALLSLPQKIRSAICHLTFEVLFPWPIFRPLCVEWHV